jgi:type I restriction enzyme S subunit
MEIEIKIPSHWNLKELDSLGSIFTGGTPSTEIDRFWNGKVNWYTPTEVSKVSKYIYESVRKISNDGLKNSSAKLLPKNTIIVCTRATIGDLVIIKEAATTNQGFKNIYCNADVNTEYVYYQILNSKDKLKRLSCGSTFLELSTSEFRKFKIPLPPLPEQQKIAEILSTWDKGIEHTQNLIKQLKLRKKGLMQQLLTGEKRLSGFSGQWKDMKFGDVAKRITHKNTELNDNVVTISAQRGFVRQEDYFNKRVASETLSGYYLIEKGDFAYNKSYSKGYSMGAFKRLDDFDKAVVTTLYICFSIKDNVNSDFLVNYFEGGLMIDNLMKIAQEGGRAHGLLNISLGDFFSLKMKLPSVKEQEAIANILSASDKEIELQQAKLESLQSQKKGLMQQLLTGQIRVN